MQKFFTDRHGKVVLGQAPNVPIGIWAICTVLNWLVGAHVLSLVLRGAGTIALIVWAVLEVGWGVSYFRRSLGVVVLSWTLLNLFW